METSSLCKNRKVTVLWCTNLANHRHQKHRTEKSNLPKKLHHDGN